MDYLELTLPCGTKFLLDIEDFPKVFGHSWHLVEKGNFYIRGWDKIKKKKIMLHRHIMNVTDPKTHVDHINGNNLDNRKSNLRRCTQQQNNYNKGLAKNNTSGYKGVTKHYNKWLANIRSNKTRIYLGLYTTPEEAAKVYDKKALELFGKYARLNFPYSPEEWP